jgi:hypothetical protein
MGFRYTSGIHSWTPVPHANGATALANASYHGLRNAAVTDVTKIKRVVITGEATSSSVNSMALRRVATTAVSTPTNVAPGPNSPAAAASSQQQFSAATTGPTLASTTHLLSAGLNAFGGIVGMQITPDDEPLMTGTALPNEEFILDAVTGTGLVTTDMLFEAV